MGGLSHHVRFNSKVDIVPYTPIFAYACVFRMNWDIYPVDSKIPYTHQQYYHHRSLHTSIEKALDRYGFDGRACLVRAFCEMVSLKHHDDLISRVLKTVFRSKEGITCPEAFNCPFSMVSLAYLLYGDEEDT
ncbi:hypothetical protein AAG570_003847 [Ranatra chinensis]|uniref:Uncharacterized protein n=1 Tax=Ranatra chinensis TaxID=642074 RepID=A0ABD0Y263_9HEMI